MNHWKRLLLPIGLGVAAAILNWCTVSAKIKPESFVAVGRDYAQGEPLRISDLVEIKLSGELGSFREAAVAWANRSILYDRPVPRDLLRGDILLARDALGAPEQAVGKGEHKWFIPLADIPMVPKLIFVGQEIGFWIAEHDEPEAEGAASGQTSPAQRDPGRDRWEYVGPFRVLAVGERLAAGAEGAEDGHKGDERTLTVAVKLSTTTKQPDERTKRLFAALHHEGNRRVMTAELTNSRNLASGNGSRDGKSVPSSAASRSNHSSGATP